MGRPNPVLWYTALMAGGAAFLSFAGLSDLMPKTAIAWVSLVLAVVGAAGGVLVRGVVTPLADPRDNEGRKLEPVGADVRDRGDDGSVETLPDVLRRPVDGEVRTHRPVPGAGQVRRPGSAPGSMPTGDPDRDWP